jgi:cellulose synthase/poly-beta-1,6-N-acetylglucosamine synthase-like glycosyltransferase
MKNLRVSIFIPIYKESEMLESLLESLSSEDYEPKEIIVVVDEPTEKTKSLAKKVKNVRFIFNGHRLGKVNALNEAVRSSKGEILLFLDGDVKIEKNGEGFLKTLVKEIEDADLVEIKKKVFRENFLTRVIYYDYLSSNVVSWLFSRGLKRSLGLNGSAFAIKRSVFEDLGGFRRVIAEDLDLATRSFLKNFRFKYSEKLEVFVKTPSKWRQVYKQRKRWGVGGALWIKEYYKDLIRNALRFPKFLLPTIPIIFPSLILFLLYTLIPDAIIYKSIMVFILVAAIKIGFLLHPFFLSVVTITLVKNLIASLLSFGAFASLFYIFARKLGYTFNPFEFLVFYFIFSPFWFSIVIASIIKVTIQKGKVEVLDWKC